MPQPLTLFSGAPEPQLLKPMRPVACVPQQVKPPQRTSLQQESGPRPPQLEEA